MLSAVLDGLLLGFIGIHIKNGEYKTAILTALWLAMCILLKIISYVYGV